MNLSFFSLSPKALVIIALLLIGIPVTVFLVGQNQNLLQKANNLEKCAPDVPPSGWPECRYGQDTYNLNQCRTHAEEWKGIPGPHGQDDTAWYIWGRYEGEKKLSCGTACGVAPSFCLVDNSPTPQPSNTPVPPSNTPVPPSNTPVPPSNTPVPPSNTPVPPSITPEPSITETEPSPTDSISSCPVPKIPADGMNVRIECPYCTD